MKTHLLKYIFSLLFLAGLLTIGKKAAGQSILFGGETTNLTTGNLTGYTNNLAIYGFQITGSNETMGTVNIKDAQGNALQSIFTNGRLYRTTTKGYNSSNPGTQIGTVTFGNGLITISNMNDPIINGVPYYYYLVADCIYTGGGTNFQPFIGYGQSPVGIISASGTNYNNNNNGYENYYHIAGGTPPAVTVSNLTGGLSSNSGNLVPSQSAVVAFGFSITTTSNKTINTFNINNSTSSVLSSYFSSATLYRCNTNDYSTATTKVAVGTASIGTNYITVTATEAVNTTTQNYFLVLNCKSSFPTVPASIQLNFSSGQSSGALIQNSPNQTFNTFNVFGNTYSLNSTVLTVTSQQNGLSSSTITAGQTGVVLFGFGVSPAAGVTISGFNINSTNTAANYFTNGILYRCNTNDYSTATSKVAVGAVNFSTNYAVVTGLTEAIGAGQTRYYFLVADNSGGGTSATIAFNFTSGQASNAITQSSPVASSYNTFNITGNTFNLPSPTLIVTGANDPLTNGITSGALLSGQTNIVLFGFSVKSFGFTAPIAYINIKTSGIENQLFANGRLYRSTTNVFPGGSPLYTSANVSIGGGGFINCTVNETIPNGTTYYYWFVADCTNSTYQAVSNYSFSFASGQSQLAFIPNPYSTTLNTYNVAGNPFYIAGIFDWAGSSSTSFTTPGNWRVNGNTPANAPTPDDLIRIGVVDYQYPANQPSITGTGNVTYSKIIFGTKNTPTLSISNGRTLILSSGIEVQAGAIATVNNAGTISLDAGAVSTISSDATLNFTTTAKLINNGILDQAGALSLANTFSNTGTVNQTGSLSVTGAGSNSGTINQTGTGTTTFFNIGSSSLNNSGTIALQGTGTFTVLGTLTNTGTITHSSNGNISLLKITNNSPGAITFGSGTNTVSTTTAIASGASLTTAGTTTFTGTVTDNGTFSSSGNTTYNALSTGASATATMGDTNTFNGNITNAGTFNGGTGTNTYIKIANTGTFNGGSGSNSFNITTSTNSGTFDSGTAANTFNAGFTNNNTGTVTFSGGTTSFNAGFTNNDTGTVNFNGGTTNFSAAFTNNDTGTVTSTAGMVNFDGAVTQNITNNSTAATPVSFYNLTLAGSGTKRLNGTGDFSVGGDLIINSGVTLTCVAGSTGNLNVTGAMTNNGTYNKNTTGTLTVGGTLTNAAGKTMSLGTSATMLNGDLNNAGTITQGTGAIDFNGATFSNTGTLTLGTGAIGFNRSGNTSISSTQALNFNNITFSNGGTKTFTSGSFNIISTGALTMSGATSLNANGNLTLKSDASSSASINAISSGASITGNVKVERFFTGGGTPALNTYRAYRLISSPVSNGLAALSYLYTGGPGGISNGFSFTNPGTSTVFLYREDVATNTGSFNSGNYKGIAALNANPFPVSTLTGTYSIYPGTGIMVYYVGSTASGVNYGTRTGSPAYYPAPDNTTMVSTGTLNQGDIPVKLWYNSGSTTLSYTTGIANTNDRGLTLVGNPYASTIDWDTFSDSSPAAGIYGPNVATTMYIYNYSTKTFGAYQVGGSGGKGTNNASRYISSGQGFFVKAATTGASLTFHESAKTTTQPNSLGASYFLMGVPDNAGNQQLLRLKLTQDNFNNEDILLSFEPNATDSYETDYDADHIKGVSNLVSLSSFAKNSGKQLSINHMHSIDSTTRVKLNFTANAAGIDTLAATGFETLDPRYDVYLLDHYKKDSLMISQYSKYFFNINPADTNSFGSTRFELVFHKKPSLANYQLLSFTGKKVDSGIQLTWKTQNETNFTGFTIQRADGSQQFLALYSLQSDGKGNYTYTDQAPEKGINQYRLMQNDAFSRISYSPVIAVDAQNVKVFDDNLMVYPNPVLGQLQVKLSDGLTNSAKVNLTIMSASGQFVFSKEVDVNAINEHVGQLQTGSYIVQITDIATKKVIGRKKFIKL